MMRALRTLFNVLIVGVSLGASLYAQQSNVGGITGTVQDGSGAVVVAAKVVATEMSTGVAQSTATNGRGAYFFTPLQIGTYSITITKAGFKVATSRNVAVIAGQTETADVLLEVGSQSQTVDVSATISGIDTTDTQQGTTRTLQELQDLPISLEGNSARAAVSAVQTFSGVNFNAQQSGGQAWTIISRSAINGLNGSSFGYEIDGLEASTGESENAQDWIAPTPDQIAEVRVTANADATQGFNSGSAIALITKSGSNKLHGAIFYYNKNDALEARNWLLPAKAEDKQSNGGWTLGGPVYIPHLYDGRNKTFFFFGMDIFRYVTTSAIGNAPVTNSVPTVLMRTGNFSELLGKQLGIDALGRPIYTGEIYDPSTSRTLSNGTTIRDPFMYNGQLNVIPPSQLSSISNFFGSHYARPTGPGVTNNWIGLAAPTTIDKDQWSLRIDQTIGRHHLMFSDEQEFGWFDALPDCPYGAYGNYGSAGYVDGVDARTARLNCANMYRYRVSETWVINPAIVVDFRAGVTRDAHRDVTPGPAAATKAACQAGLIGTLSCNTPDIAPENYGAIGPTTFFRLHSQRTPFTISASWAKGNHFLTFGAEYVTCPFIYGNLQGSYGSFSFSHLETSLPGTYTNQTGAGIASFYLGVVHSGNVISPITGKVNTSEGAFFVQDKWRVSNKLTLNVGLRWELTFPINESHNRISTFDPNLANTKAGGHLGGLNIGLHQVGDYYYKAFAPKIGIAYAFTPKTVFRANFDISYFPYWSKWVWGNGSSLPSDAFNQSKTIASLNNGLTGYFNWQGGFPYTFPAFPLNDPTLDNGGPISYVDPKFIRPPQVENVGAEIEQQLPWHIVGRVAYVGTLAHRLYASYDMNQIPLSALSMGSLLNQSATSPQAVAAGVTLPYPGFGGTVAQALQPYPQYTAITNMEAQIGDSSYNSMQINVQRHFGELTFLTAATFAKWLTTTDNPGQGNQLATLKSQSYQLPGQAKSLGGYKPWTLGSVGDIPKQINLSWYWDLPLGRKKHFLAAISRSMDYLIGNWRLSAIQNYQSGGVIGVTTNDTVPGIGSVWAVRNASVPVLAVSSCSNIRSSNTAYLSRAAFSDPAPYTLGNVYVLPNVRSCGYFNEDVGVEKGFSFGEKRLISFGAIVTNVFNRHQFHNLTTNIDSAAFGTYGNASFPRTVQLHARITF